VVRSLDQIVVVIASILPSGEWLDGGVIPPGCWRKGESDPVPGFYDVLMVDLLRLSTMS
jgi:hypothetical protein